MKLTFVGCGDAFGSGGRLNTCFHVEASSTSFLIDCGASSVAGLKRLQIERNAIDTILITHFHGDHFGGIPYFILDAQLFAKRTRPLIVAGPEGLTTWYKKTLETAFPGSSETNQKFDLELVEIVPGKPTSIGGLEVIAARVRHGPLDGPFFAYR
ncbi:MAG: MBL fold metallo-hydrolase, partial [Pseudomonadota bacterium]